MKVLYFANIRFPTERAHGVQIAKMCEAFSDAGASVTLVVPNRAVTIDGDPYEYYGVKTNFNIIKIGKREDPQSNLGYWISYVKFALRLSAYCSKNKADVYYSRDESIVFILSLFGVGVVWEAHGWKGGALVGYFLRTIKKIVVITSIAKRQFVEGGVSEQKIIVAPDGVDSSLIDARVDKIFARKKLGLPAEGKLAFYVGSLSEWKGFQTLLQCADTLAKKQITVVLVGGIVEKLKKEFPNVIFLDFIPYKELATVQAAADVLVIPNSAKSVVSTDYTSPLKLFAHMASDRPIVASRLPSLREVLDEETAYFFAPDNPKSLAETIIYALAHTEESNEKARKALAKVREYTWDERARKILAFIGE
ncbi:MAG: glycosyltransferase family 4 protein [Patescibacteria group bacterium]|nr:glycosyltransferase family 4 protein [Patescibacteria group bacterium]